MTPSFVRKSEPFASSGVTAPSFEPSIATTWSTWISLKPASLVPQPPPPAAAARRKTTGRTRSVLMRCASRLRQPQDGDRRARLVPAVQIEEERGDRLQVARVGDAPGVHGAKPGQEPDQRRDLGAGAGIVAAQEEDRKSTRLNSSHGYISYAVFCLKKKKTHTTPTNQHQN